MIEAPIGLTTTPIEAPAAADVPGELDAPSFDPDPEPEDVPGATDPAPPGDAIVMYEDEDEEFDDDVGVQDEDAGDDEESDNEAFGDEDYLDDEYEYDEDDDDDDPYSSGYDDEED